MFNIKIVFDMVENIVGIGESAGHQHFLRFPQRFQKALFSLRDIKSRPCVVKGTFVIPN